MMSRLQDQTFEADVEKRRYRNFDTIRLWAALSVIFSHSFLIGAGSEDGEPLKTHTGEVAGYFGVHMFFVMSGFLITGSRMTSPSTANYAWKRFLRVYPAYSASLLLSFLVLGPFFVTGGAEAVFGSLETWRLLLHTLLFDFERAYLPDLQFHDGGVIATTLNGVLWTIQAEVLLYIAVGLLFYFRLLNLPVCLLMLAFAVHARLGKHYIGFMISDETYLNLWPITLGAPGFFAGASLWFVFRHHKPRASIAAVMAALAVAGVLASEETRMVFAVLAAYPILWLGSQDAPDLGNWTQFGDLSYGIYVFGWPVQQLVRSVTGPLDGWTFFLASVGPVVLLGWLSWTVIEKPALGLKNWVD